MSCLAIITARGGSKRIPRKNIKPFLGRPIIEYSITAALDSGLFDEVMVSTDDVEIAEIGKHAGANVPFFRSEGTANDYATTADVILEVLEEYKKIGRTFDYVCCIYPTAPFVTPDNIHDSMKLLIDKEADSVLPVVKFSFPPQRAVVINEEKVQAKWAEFMNMRSQDLEPFYHDCGQFYCLNVDRFMEEKKMIMTHTVPYVQEEIRVQDIDTPEDWEMAEMKYTILAQRGKAIKSEEDYE